MVKTEFEPEAGVQVKLYGPVPPVATTVAAPVAEPVHTTLTEFGVSVKLLGCVILKPTVWVQAFWSVMVMVWGPKPKPLATDDVLAEGDQA